MHIVEIPEKKKTFNIPTHLGECSKSQYISMCNLLFSYLSKDISFEEFKILAIYHLMNMVPSHKIDDKTQINKMTNVVLLAELIESFFETNEEETQKIIKLYYINNPIENIKSGDTNYYGPTDEFNNVKFGEYVDALSHFADFHATRETKYLFMLMATFYREKKILSSNVEDFTKDIRIKYNAERVSELAKTFEIQDIGVIYGFYLLFASFQKYLTTAKLYIEGKEIDLSILFDDSNFVESEVPGIGMKSTLYTVAESGIFGTLKEVRETPLWEILVRLYDIRKRDLDVIANSKQKQK